MMSLREFWPWEESRLAAQKKLTSVTELNDLKISGQEAIKVLLTDVKAFNEASKGIRSLAAEEGDGVTEDQFNNYVGAYEKLIWMLEAYLEK